MTVNQETRGQHHQRKIFSTSGSHRRTGDQETEKWQDDEARHPWNEQPEIPRNELKEFSDRAEMPGGEKQRQTKKPTAGGPGACRNQCQGGTEEKCAQPVERDQLSVERS